MDKRRQTARMLGGALFTATLSCVLAWIGKTPQGPTRPVPAIATTSHHRSSRLEHVHPARDTLRTRQKNCSPLGTCGQFRATRLADRLKEARYEGPNPIRAYRRLQRHWLKMLDPYSEMDPLRAHMRLKVAFMEPKARRYLAASSNALSRGLRPKIRNWHWARRGVYESRLALFAPFPDRRGTRARLPNGASYAFDVFLPENPVLEFAVGVIARRPGFVPRPRFAVDVEVGGKVHRVWETRVERLRFSTWLEHQVALRRFSGRSVRLHLRSWGADAVGLWADPQVWGEGTRQGDNVLFVVVDCMRPDGVRALGGRHAITPNMDRLARRGVRMTRFFANGSWTRASMVSFFSADYPSALGLGTHSFALPRGTRERFYSARPPQLPLHLERHGYATAAAINNHFALPYASSGIDHGFPHLTDVRDPFLDNEVINRTAVRFMTKHRNRAFFLYVHYETVHNYPRRPNIRRRLPLPPRTRMNRRFREYLAQTRLADRHVGALLGAVKKLGLEGRTLVILTADHGETFDRRHDHFVFHYMMRMRFQHARSVWDEVSRVPMVWAMPGRVARDRELGTQLRAIDLAPSLLEFLRLPPMKSVAGRSFWPLVESLGAKPVAAPNGRESDRPVYTEGFRIRGLRAFGHKYIYRDPQTRTFYHQGRVYHRKEELFDLTTDSAETRDLSRKKPELLARMRELMLRIRSRSKNATAHRHEKGSWPVYHLRLCGDGMPARLTGRVRVLGGPPGIVVTGARGRVRISPLDPVDRQLALSVHSLSRCAGLDWSAPPDATLKLELFVNGRRLDPSKIRAGPFGLSLLGRSVLDLTTASLLTALRPPETAAGRDLGVFLWQDRVTGGAWFDSAAAGRDRASEELVRFNLRQGGYVKD